MKRDFNICKNCEKLLTSYFVFADDEEKKENIVHACVLMDDMPMECEKFHDHDIPNNCPYRTEHCINEWNGDEKKQDDLQAVPTSD